MSAAVNQQRPDEVVSLLKRYSVFLTLLFIPIAIGVLLFADVLVGLIGGGKYVHTEAANIYRIMIVCALLYPVERFLGVTLDIIGQPQINLIKVIIALVVNALGDFVAIHFTHSIYGAAVASALTLLASLLYGYVVLRRFLPFDLRGVGGLVKTESRQVWQQATAAVQRLGLAKV
jgi:O-antigen/teichoic acid export membrane protein